MVAVKMVNGLVLNGVLAVTMVKGAVVAKKVVAVMEEGSHGLTLDHWDDMRLSLPVQQEPQDAHQHHLLLHLHVLDHRRHHHQHTMVQKATCADHMA